MFSELSLVSTSLGLLLFLIHLVALQSPSLSKRFLQHFPRSPQLGILLLSTAGIWAFILASTIDLGEFTPFRFFILLGIVTCTILFGLLVPDFLAVRSLGFLGLLAAHPILEITFLQSGWSSFLLSLLSYIWIVIGLFLVGIPYLLRNCITTITKPQQHWLWNLLCWFGILYGSALVGGGILSFYSRSY